MSTVAEQLQQAREARNLSIEQVAGITKIRGDHIRALESGDFDAFSAPVYIRGFVRTYSTLLKMDVPQVMAALDGELGRTAKFAEPPALTDRQNGVLDFLALQLSKIDWPKALVLLGVLFVAGGTVAGVAIWRHQRAKDPLRNIKPPMYQSNPKTSGETLPLPTPKK